MKVDGRSGDVDLGVHDPAQPDGDRRHVALEEPRIADEGDVRLEPILVLGEPALEVDPVRLLVALEHELQVDGESAADREDRLGCPQVEVELALVVGGTAGKDPVTDDHRLERR